MLKYRLKDSSELMTAREIHYGSQVFSKGTVFELMTDGPWPSETLILRAVETREVVYVSKKRLGKDFEVYMGGFPVNPKAPYYTKEEKNDAEIE